MRIANLFQNTWNFRMKRTHSKPNSHCEDENSGHTALFHLHVEYALLRYFYTNCNPANCAAFIVNRDNKPEWWFCDFPLGFFPAFKEYRYVQICHVSLLLSYGFSAKDLSNDMNDLFGKINIDILGNFGIIKVAYILRSHSRKSRPLPPAAECPDSERGPLDGVSRVVADGLRLLIVEVLLVDILCIRVWEMMLLFGKIIHDISMNFLTRSEISIVIKYAIKTIHMRLSTPSSFLPSPARTRRSQTSSPDTKSSVFRLVASTRKTSHHVGPRFPRRHPFDRLFEEKISLNLLITFIRI